MARKVLILRPDNLGDVVLFSGALRHIRARYPSAEITLCVKRYVRNMLDLCPHVDRLVAWEDMVSPPLPSFLDLRGGTRLNVWLRHLMNKKYSADVVLLPVRSPTGGALGMHAMIGNIPGKEKYGICGDFCNQSIEDDEATENFYTKRLHLSEDRRWQHEFYILRDFLRFVGINISVDELWPDFWTDINDRRWAEQAIPRPSKSIILGIAPGVTSKEGKFYSGSNIARAISSIKPRHFSVCIFGSHSDILQCELVARHLRACRNVRSVTNFVGQTTVRQLIEGLRRCDVALAQETASLHVAVALHKPTVGIIGGGHYARFYPWGDPTINRVANRHMDCYCCNWNCQHVTIRCIEEISTDRIAEELELALKATELPN